MMSDITIKQLMEEIIKNRSEIKSSIEASEARLLLNFEELKNRVLHLEKENQDLKEEIEELKKSGKKNNVIIFGLTKKSETPTCDIICQKINSSFSTSLTHGDINDFYFLGNNDTSPLKVEFKTFLIKKEVLQKRQHLKGTNISIVHDQTQKQREESKLPRKYLLKARQEENNTCYIKNNKLHVNTEVYRVSDLLALENQTVEEPKSISASSTPTPETQPETRQQQKIRTTSITSNQQRSSSARLQ